MELTLDQALQKGIEAHKAGKVQEADRYYTAILKANPKHPDANHNMGVLAVGVGKVEAALPFFKTALEANANIAQFWLSYIDALIKLDRIADAKALFDQAKSKGATGDGFDQIEKRLVETEVNAAPGKLQEPHQEQLQSLINLYTQGKYQEALTQASQLLEQFPSSVVLHNIVGATNKSLGNLDEAIEAYKKAISIKPDYADAYNNMGIALKTQGNLDEAIEAYKKAISIKPNYAEAHNNMGIALREQGKLEEAIGAYTKAIAIKPDHADAHNNIGVALQEQGKLEEAIGAYTKAIAIKSDYAEAYNNMGNAFQDLGNPEKAIEAFKKALTIKPDSAEAYKNMGNALRGKGKLDEAIAAYNKALSIKPHYGSAQHMLSALTGNTQKTAPREYVENLFDGYSKKFEASLVNTLEYKIPKLVRDILIKSNRNRSLGSVLDLGCGTGLFGLEIRDHCSQLEGIDLSNNMLEIAKNKNIYDTLSQSDIVEYLSENPLDFDYYIALDVFIYVGELTEIFRLIGSRNEKPGYLVFSTEHTELDGYHILKSGRYSHSKSYIESLCKKFSYKISHFSTTKLRKEKSSFLTGGIYILEFGNTI